MVRDAGRRKLVGQAVPDDEAAQASSVQNATQSGSSLELIAIRKSRQAQPDLRFSQVMPDGMAVFEHGDFSAFFLLM